MPVIEVIDFDIDLDDYEQGLHKAKDAPACEITCQIAGHKLYNAFTIDESVPSGTLLRVWLYQNPKMNPTKLL